MSISIAPASEKHFEGLHLALDTVAREKSYLVFLKAPPRNEAYAFFHRIAINGYCQLVALDDDTDTVVGWCDILPEHGEARSHVGTLGIGLTPAARHRGIGSMLMEAAIASAWAKGLKRIELTVRADNHNAKRLYERFGFETEGLNRSVFCVNGEFFDTCSMALLRKPLSPC